MMLMIVNVDDDLNAGDVDDTDDTTTKCMTTGGHFLTNQGKKIQKENGLVESPRKISWIIFSSGQSSENPGFLP